MQKSPPSQYTQKQAKSIIKIQNFWRVSIARRKFKQNLKQIRRKKFTANQLLSSEKTYCKDLKFIVKQVLQPSKLAIQDQQLHQIVFSNITQIYLMHHVFLYKLQQIMNNYTPHQTKISQPLLKLFSQQKFMSSYTNYCFNYPKADKIIKLLTQNNSAFKEILKKCKISNSAQSLQSYMIKPVQRLCKYQLMLKGYHKNMMVTHVDYDGVKKVIGIIQALVQKTNSQVEEFLFRERERQLRYEYPQILSKMDSTKSATTTKLVHQFDKGTVSIVHLLKQQQSLLQSIVVFSDFLFLIPKSSTEKPTILQILHVRKLQNMKYFKNLLQVVDEKRYYTFEFKQEKQRDMMFQVICEKTIYNRERRPFSTVHVLGTERRESFFKFYTVYIVEITQCQRRSRQKEEKTRSNDQKKSVRQSHQVTLQQKRTRIYPRFKNLIKVQDFLLKRNLFQQLNVIPLQKQSPHLTLKSRTIQKRKLHIRQFLQRLINHQRLLQLQEVRQTLQYYQGKQQKKSQRRKQDNQEEISILLPNWQTIRVLINCKTSKVKQLKERICMELEFTQNTQFQVFEIRNRNYSTRRLMYDNESLLSIYEAQHELNINPFADKVEFMFSRHYYLSKEEELALYKLDFIRLELELSVIKMEILNYALEQQLMITFMCLFAMYINLPLQQDKISSLIKEIGKKTYKITPKQFRLYYHQVQTILSAEEDQPITIPFLIIKILTNNRLYQSQQFEVQIHKKCFKNVEKEIPGIEQHIFLAVKLEHLLLLTIKEKHLIKTLNYNDISSMEMHPNGIIFTLNQMETLFRIKTVQGYEISKLISIYKDKKV